MAKSSANVFYVVGLIFSILVSLVLVFVAFRLNEDLTAAQERIQSAERRRDEAIEDRTKQFRELKEIRQVIHGTDEPVTKEEIVTSILEPASKRLHAIISAEWGAVEEWRNLDDETLKTAWENILENPEGPGREYKNVTQLFFEIYDQLTALMHIIPHLRVQRFTSREEVEQIRQEKQNEARRMQGELATVRREKNRIQDEKITQEQDFDAAKQGLQRSVENLQSELGELERDRRLEEARLLSQLGERDARIKQLTKKKSRTFGEFGTADGEVVYADPSLGYAWINLGRRHGLRRNTTFQVYQFVKGGRQKIKGVIEVRKVEEDWAQCAIAENVEVQHPITGERVLTPDPDDPIVKGDKIRTPYFDPQERKVFVFLGTSVQNRFYNRKELETKLEEFGARIDRQVTTETDFVIRLGGIEEDTDLQAEDESAARFGVTFMDESELLDYLGAE